MSDPLDILDFDDAKAALNLNESSVNHDETIASLVTAVSRRIDAITGPVVKRTVTETVDACGNIIALGQWPVASITSVTEYHSGAGTALTLEDADTAGDYLLRDATLYRRSSWTPYSWSGQVTVVYVAGRYVDTESVDALFKHTARIVLSGVWQKYAPVWAQGGSVYTDGPQFYDEVMPTVERWLGHEMPNPVLIG